MVCAAHLSRELSLHLCPCVLLLLLLVQVAKDMSAMLDLHGISKASMLAHSYGTFYVSCLLKLIPERVRAQGTGCSAVLASSAIAPA